MTLDDLLDAAATSARAIASGPLRASELHWSGVSSAPLPTKPYGIYIPLITPGFSLQLGLLASREVCSSLARALLGDLDASMESDEEVFDAMGEIANLIAGNVKVLLVDRVNISLGVPLAMRGRVFPLGGSQSLRGILTIDRNDVWLVMAGTQTS